MALPAWPIGKLVAYLALFGTASAQQPTATDEEKAFARAWDDRNLAVVRSIVDAKPAWLNREEWLGKAVQSVPLFTSLLLASGADPRKLLQGFNGYSARDVAFASCNPKVMPVLLGYWKDDAPVDWRRPVRTAATAKRILVEIGLMSCRLRCSTLEGFKGCLPDEQMNQLRSRAEFLLGRWGGSRWQQTPYDNALLSVLSVLQSYAVRPSERGHQAAKEAVEDFLAIADDCEHGPSGAGRLLPIAVHTVLDSKENEKSGWQILYKRKLFELDDSVEYELFPTLSSPATAKLPPGRYVVVARKGDLKTPPMTQKTVPGSTEMTWIIPINLATQK